MNLFHAAPLLVRPLVWATCLAVLFWSSRGLAETPRTTDPSTTPRQISGVYPHLAYWNGAGECGTGAVVPWADRLWVITYAPHCPEGSDDQLYAISQDLRLVPFGGSVGGTPANRMIHPETNQLLIGPYVIDSQGNVRVIPPRVMPGRLTGNARHLFEPERKAYYATMEEGIYEVDLQTLEVHALFHDYQGGADWHRQEGDQPTSERIMGMPGYHGKGLYSGQGRLIYANNGEFSQLARERPEVPAGCLAEWDGKSEKWNLVRRNQFTDIRGPGDLTGNLNPETDPVWALGWDHRSVMLMLLDQGEWSGYRLPKAAHTYDGAHGWNTEWPRIRDLGEPSWMMNMHGMFWHFPPTFSRANSAGIAPRSTYLKVIGDYCRWGDRLVLGCDDTAKNEFLNQRRAKGKIAGPGQSHSNLWFVEPSLVDQLGPPLGRGAVWVNDMVNANSPSDPYLFHGFKRRSVHLKQESESPVTFTLEVDRQGNDEWTKLTEVVVPAKSAVWHSFKPDTAGIWIRVSVDRPCQGVSAQFAYSTPDPRSTEADPMFAALATPESTNLSGGLVRVRGEGRKTLAFAAQQVVDGAVSAPAYYELTLTGEMGDDLQLNPVDDAAALTSTLKEVPMAHGVLQFDAASASYVDDDGRRWRLPLGNPAMAKEGLLGPSRIDREVVTERDLFNCGGLFYELPARNAGGFAKIRPICTHNRRIHDYCSYRGLLIFSGVVTDASRDGEHVLRSTDGRVALWAGVVDDLWKFGKPVGVGGPWHDTAVERGVPSDPYLMTGFDQKTVALSHHSAEPVTITLQVDIDGTGSWVDYRAWTLPAGETVTHTFPESFAAYWVRAVANQATTATVGFRYE